MFSPHCHGEERKSPKQNTTWSVTGQHTVLINRTGLNPFSCSGGKWRGTSCAVQLNSLLPWQGSLIHAAYRKQILACATSWTLPGALLGKMPAGRGTNQARKPADNQAARTVTGQGMSPSVVWLPSVCWWKSLDPAAHSADLLTLFPAPLGLLQLFSVSWGVANLLEYLPLTAFSSAPKKCWA